MKKMVFAGAVVAVLVGCASNPQQSVIPLQNNRYEVTQAGESKDAALQKALAGAESTCKARNLRHVVVSQSDSYKGVVSESTNKQIDTAATILATLSRSYIPTLSGEDDYSVKLTFACE